MLHRSPLSESPSSPCALHGPVFLSKLHRSLHRRIPHCATVVLSLVHAQYSPLRVSHNRPFPRWLPSSLSLCMHASSPAPTPPLASPRARSMVPFSCRGSIVPCTVASLVHVSLPLSISPSPDDAAPSPPAQVSYRPHKPRQCCIVSTNPVNAASFLTLSPPHRSSIAPTHPRQCSFFRRRPLPPSTATLPHRGSVIRYTVASLTGLPSSLPSCMRPFPCQTVLSPLTLPYSASQHPFRRRSCAVPSSTDLPSSFPASMPHRPAPPPVHITPFLDQSTLHCPLPQRTTIVPG